MIDVKQDAGMPSDIKPEMPSGINVLTILTFVGCVIGLLGSLWGFARAKATYDQMYQAVNNGTFDNLPSFMKKMASPEMLEVYRKSYENRLPILILSLVAIALCFVGALQMRKLKAQGYYLYLVGEILPIIASFVFIGAGIFSGLGMIGLIFPILFIILYTVQRKYLVH